MRAILGPNGMQLFAEGHQINVRGKGESVECRRGGIARSHCDTNQNFAREKHKKWHAAKSVIAHCGHI